MIFISDIIFVPAKSDVKVSKTDAEYQNISFVCKI